MTRGVIIGAACAVALTACHRGGEVKAASAQPPPAVAGGAFFPPALRAEALLEDANFPYASRYDLYPAAFPEGCVFLAVYGTLDPEVILETYAFGDEAAAREYANARSVASAGETGRVSAAVTNGELVLVAWYKTGADEARKEKVASRFTTAFEPVYQ